MHFVFGGAFNGKGKWVREQYSPYITDWFSAYKGNPLPTLLPGKSRTVVIEGIEMYIRELIGKDFSVEQVRLMFEELLKSWEEWESRDRRLILIATEIGKGIVPIEKEERACRDACGYVYQLFAKKATLVNYVWYGIPENLKGGE